MQVAFEDLPATVTAVRIGDIRDAWVRYDWFENVAGDAIVQRADVAQLFVTDTEFTGVGAAIRIGCDDGTCSTPLFDVSDNLIVGSELGITIAPGSWGTALDNVVSSTGTAIRVSGDPRGTIEIAGGLLETTGPALEVLAGPVLARANIAIGAPAVRAVGAELAGVRLVGNTFVGELDLAGWGPGRDLALVSDAILGSTPDAGGADTSGTVSCDDRARSLLRKPHGVGLLPGTGIQFIRSHEFPWSPGLRSTSLMEKNRTSSVRSFFHRYMDISPANHLKSHIGQGSLGPS